MLNTRTDTTRGLRHRTCIPRVVLALRVRANLFVAEAGVKATYEVQSVIDWVAVLWASTPTRTSEPV